jgi:hypothetical protein
MSVLSRDRGFIAPAAVVCLAAVIASTCRARSQTRQVRMRDRSQRPMDRMIEGLKRGGAEFPVVEYVGSGKRPRPLRPCAEPRRRTF